MKPDSLASLTGSPLRSVPARAGAPGSPLGSVPASAVPHATQNRASLVTDARQFGQLADVLTAVRARSPDDGPGPGAGAEYSTAPLLGCLTSMSGPGRGRQ